MLDLGHISPFLLPGLTGYSSIQPWHVVVAYQIINFFCYLFNCFGKSLPLVAKGTLYISLLSFFVILIAVPACASPHQSGQYVFAHFVNSTGWKSDGMAFIVGLINPNWIFACLDSATHMAEEVPQPERNIPIAILTTVAIGFTTSWFYCISMFFSLKDLNQLINSTTQVPILELYYQALNNKAGAIVLETLLLVTGMGCLIACHTWQSRLVWSFARDRGVPGHQYISRVNFTLDVPFISHSVSCFIVGVLGLLYLGSSTAFNSMVTACITLLYISYTTPILCLWYRGRNNIQHGPFWLGKWGLVANIVTLLWTVFCLVMYSFPSTMPATTGSKSPLSPVGHCEYYVNMIRYELRLCRVRSGGGPPPDGLVYPRQKVVPGSAGIASGRRCYSINPVQ